MDNNLNKIFKDLNWAEPSLDLESSILRKIELKIKRKLQIELFVSRLGLGISLSLLFVAGFAFGDTLVSSDFWQVFSLIFSDSVLIAKHWEEFSFSLLETFPFMSAIAIMTPLFLFFLSGYFYFQIHQSISMKNSKPKLSVCFNLLNIFKKYERVYQIKNVQNCRAGGWFNFSYTDCFCGRCFHWNS